jgi:hypothetical protein
MMFEDTETLPGPDLQPAAATQEDRAVERAARRPISGIVFLAQKTRLVLDAPDAAGKATYPCRIFDFSAGGFGVVCHALAKSRGAFHLGAQMTLEAWDGKRSRVEIRWINNARIGLKCVEASPA